MARKAPAPDLPASPQDTVSVALTREEFKNVITALSKWPYDQVIELIEKIQKQLKVKADA